MGAIFSIVGALLPILIQTLQGYKAISPQLGSLITGIEGAAAAVATELTGPTGTPSITATSLLNAISAGVSVLQTQTNISPTTLLIIAAFDSAVQAGLAASQITSVDPTKLTPVTPV